jgi:hypothetical protein
MLKKRKFFWWGILLLILIVAGWCYYQYQRPHQSAGGEAANVTIAADSLYIQYVSDEKRSDGKYLGKVIQVSGKLSEIQHSGQSEIWILSTGNAGGVNCQLFPGEKIPEPHPKPGDQVTVKGRCSGFLMDVNLSDCIVIK